MKQWSAVVLLGWMICALSACNGGPGSEGPLSLGTGGGGATGANPPVAALPAPSQPSPITPTHYDFLLYTGSGADSNSAACIQSMLDSSGFTYQLIDEVRLNEVTADDLKKFSAILWPDGDVPTMSQAISTAIADLIHTSVQTAGLGFGSLGGGSVLAALGSGGASLLIPVGLELLNTIKASNGSSLLGSILGFINKIIPIGNILQEVLSWGESLFGVAPADIQNRLPSGEAAWIKTQLGTGAVSVLNPSVTLDASCNPSVMSLGQGIVQQVIQGALGKTAGT